MTTPAPQSAQTEQLEARLDRIEARLDRIVSVLDQALPALAMATDSADEWLGRAQARGIDVDARARAAIALTERLTEPDTVAALSAVVEALPRLELATTLAASLEPTLAMASDALDAQVARLQARGIDVDARAHAAIALTERLTEPDTVAALSAVVEALPRLELATTLAASLEPTLAMASDALDAQIAGLQARGVDIDERIGTLGGLLEQLTDGDNAAALASALEALPRLEFVLTLATALEPTVAMLSDMFDEHVAGWQARGIDAEDRILSVASMVERLTEPAFQQHLEVLLDAAPDLMAATRTGRLFGMAIDEVQSQSAAPIGAIGLLRALSDPEVKRAAGFAVAVARRVGKRLPDGPSGS